MISATEFVQLISGGRGSAIDRLRRDDTLIRTRAALTVRLAFVAADGGTGCSSAAGAVAGILAARRPGPTLLVNADGEGADALHSAGMSSQVQARLVVDAPLREQPTRLAEALDGLPATETGLRGLDLARLTGRVAPADPVLWRESVGPIARFLDVICTDFGRRSLTDAHHIAESSACTVVTARPDRMGLERAGILVRSLHERHRRVVLCVTDLARTANRGAIAELTAGLGDEVSVVAHEPALAAPGRVRSLVDARSRRGRYRQGLIHLAAQLMAPATRGAAA
ncbi:MAG: hypothetical protein ACK5KO_04745 [Arachnia sp.]